LRVFVFY